jgi:hypothetical protein
VEVEVEDGLAGLPAGVGDEAVVADAPVARDGGGADQDLSEERRVVRGVVHVDEMLLRDQEDVRRRLRVDVLERQDPLVLVHLFRRDLARRDLAEKAVAHDLAPLS